MTAIFVGSPIYRGSTYGSRHPLSIERVSAASDLARALGLLPDQCYRRSPRAKPAALERFHTRAYVRALQEAETRGAVSAAVRARHGLGTASNPVFEEMFRRPATAVGGGLLAAELVRDGGIVFNPGGGTHHGFPDRAAGFCFLNEPVLTIQTLLHSGLRRVAYVDIDAHHGDGVEQAFWGSERVRVISVHEAGRWPFTGALQEDAGGASFNLPVPKGFHDDEFDFVLEEMILPVVQGFHPEAVFLQCGADALLEDPLSRLALSNNAHRRAVRALRELSPRLIVSGGGGYNPWSVARCWTAVWAEISGVELPERMPEAGHRVLERLTWPRKGRPDEEMLRRVRDGHRGGVIRGEIREGVAVLRGRAAGP